MKAITVIFLLFISIGLYAQTELEGGIYENKTLTLEESPYLVTGDVVLFPEKTLTIEPGVNLIFEDDYYLEIRGNLIAKGTIEDTIKFSTLNDSIVIDSTPWEQFDWEEEKIGLIFDYSTSNIDISFCSFSKFKKAICLYQISVDSSINIKNCLFEMNNFGFINFSDNHSIFLDSCLFDSNSIGLVTGHSIIQNSTFINNYFGIRESFDNDVFKTNFISNSIGIENATYGLIENSNFEDNLIGIINSWEGIEMRNNTIYNNLIGIRFNLSDTTSINMITENEICYNDIYNVENLGITNIALNSNCWCTSDSAEIEDKIFDGYDDINSGLINYDIFDDSCSSILSTVTKINISSTPILLDEYSYYKIYPNPFTEYIEIGFPSHQVNCEIRLLDITGRIVFNKVISNMKHYQIDTHEFENGIYIMEIRNGIVRNREILIKR